MCLYIHLSNENINALATGPVFQWEASVHFYYHHSAMA